MKPIPDRWLEYTAHGTVIENTKILAFKVPLKTTINVPPKQQFTTSLLMEAFPKLKFVIDLTNTKRYYDKNEFTSKDIGYLKIMVPGKQVPPESCVLKFFKAMDEFLSTAKDDEVIGVHCTHGLNRTGYLICRYLVQQLGWNLDDAVKAFNEGRGHPMERQEYIEHLTSAPRGEKIDTSAIVLTNDTRPVAKKSRGNRARVMDNRRNHSPMVPGRPARIRPNGPKWCREQKALSFPQYPPSRPNLHPHLAHDKAILQPDTAIPPPSRPGFQIVGPNLYRMPHPMGPPAVHGLPDSHFSIHTPCPPRPVFPGSRSTISDPPPSAHPQSYSDAFINDSDKFHTRNNRGAGTGGPVRLRGRDIKNYHYDRNFHHFNNTMRRREQRRPSHSTN